MNHAIKLARARRLSDTGRFPRSFEARLAAIPDHLIDALSARPIASIIDGPMASSYRAGRAAEAAELTELSS